MQPVPTILKAAPPGNRGTIGHPKRARKRHRWLIPLLLVALLAACGGGALSEEALSTITEGEQNQAQLSLSDDLAHTELLDGNTGAVTTLADVVTGDRPILVWYWAPD